MSVPVPKRKPGELEVDTLARTLCVYTLRITGNEKTFPQNQASFSELIRRTALQIHTLCWRANNIRVDGNAMRYRARLEAQERAADLCNDLYAMIEVAKPLYHLSSRRCVFWQDQVVKVRGCIRSWSESDAKRLKPEG